MTPEEEKAIVERLTKALGYGVSDAFRLKDLSNSVGYTVNVNDIAAMIAQAAFDVVKNEIAKRDAVIEKLRHEGGE